MEAPGTFGGAMHFLAERPRITLSDDGTKYTSFVADVIAERPPFAEIAGFRQAATAIQDSMQKLIERAASPIGAAAIVVDAVGACILFSTTKRLSVQNARTAIDTVVATLHADQRRAVEKTVRPVDELDKCRVENWDIASAPTVRRERELPAICPPGAWRAFIQSDSDDEEPVAPPRLMLTDVEQTSSTPALTDTEHTMWQEYVKGQCVIMVCSAGELQLTFIRCHREDRRKALLARELTSSSTLVAAVRAGIALATAGALPGLRDGARWKKADFLKRCAAALALKAPAAERDAKKLAPGDQRALALALDDRMCIRCAKSPGTTTGDALPIVWACVDDVNIPELAADSVYCGSCAETVRVVYCPRCGKNDAIETTGERTAVVDYGLCLAVVNSRCKRCSCVAWLSDSKASTKWRRME
jgi:hypothetical protein